MFWSAMRMTEVRVLNEAGIARFQAFLSAFKASPSDWRPPTILDDSEYAEPISGHATVETRAFTSKYEFGCYMVDRLKEVPTHVTHTSLGLWNWLALFYIDELCPPDDRGRRKVLSLEKYITKKGHRGLDPDKHLLFFPWKLVARHGSHAEWLLRSSLREDTKVVRELANSYRRNVSTPFLDLAKALYFDESNNRVRRGATTNKPGRMRRLDRVLSQLDLTFDIFDLRADQLAELLPKGEFGRWLTNASFAPPSSSDDAGVDISR